MEELVLSYRLKELRKKNHYTQEFISSSLNLGRSAYSNYELGKRMPSLDIIVDFAEFYQVSLGYLLFSDEQYLSSVTLEHPERSLLTDELLLLNQYRSLTKLKKQEVIDFITFLKTRS